MKKEQKNNTRFRSENRHVNDIDLVCFFSI